MGLCLAKKRTFTASIRGVRLSEEAREEAANESCRVFVVQGGGVLTATNKKPLLTDGAVLFNEEVVFSARSGPLSFVVGAKPASGMRAELPRAEETAGGAMELVVLVPRGDEYERVGELTLTLTRHDAGGGGGKGADERTPLARG